MQGPNANRIFVQSLVDFIKSKSDTVTENKTITPTRSRKIMNLANTSPDIQKNPLKLFGKNLETSSPLVVKGSQLNRVGPSRRSTLLMKTPSPSRRNKCSMFITDDKSSDYVKIDTKVKFEPKKLNDHQKEVMKRRRDDIPALYQDLSQSQTQDFSNSSEANPKGDDDSDKKKTKESKSDDNKLNRFKEALDKNPVNRKRYGDVIFKLPNKDAKTAKFSEEFEENNEKATVIGDFNNSTVDDFLSFMSNSEPKMTENTLEIKHSSKSNVLKLDEETMKTTKKQVLGDEDESVMNGVIKETPNNTKNDVGNSENKSPQIGKQINAIIEDSLQQNEEEKDNNKEALSETDKKDNCKETEESTSKANAETPEDKTPKTKRQKSAPTDSIRKSQRQMNKRKKFEDDCYQYELPDAKVFAEDPKVLQNVSIDLTIDNVLQKIRKEMDLTKLDVKKVKGKKRSSGAAETLKRKSKTESPKRSVSIDPKKQKEMKYKSNRSISTPEFNQINGNYKENTPKSPVSLLSDGNQNEITKEKLTPETPVGTIKTKKISKKSALTSRNKKSLGDGQDKRRSSIDITDHFHVTADISFDSSNNDTSKAPSDINEETITIMVTDELSSGKRSLELPRKKTKPRQRRKSAPDHLDTLKLHSFNVSKESDDIIEGTQDLKTVSLFLPKVRAKSRKERSLSLSKSADEVKELSNTSEQELPAKKTKRLKTVVKTPESSNVKSGDEESVSKSKSRKRKKVSDAVEVERNRDSDSFPSSSTNDRNSSKNLGHSKFVTKRRPIYQHPNSDQINDNSLQSMDETLFEPDSVVSTRKTKESRSTPTPKKHQRLHLRKKDESVLIGAESIKEKAIEQVPAPEKNERSNMSTPAKHVYSKKKEKRQSTQLSLSDLWKTSSSSASSSDETTSNHLSIKGKETPNSILNNFYDGEDKNKQSTVNESVMTEDLPATLTITNESVTGNVAASDSSLHDAESVIVNMSLSESSLSPNRLKGNSPNQNMDSSKETTDCTKDLLKVNKKCGVRIQVKNDTKRNVHVKSEEKKRTSPRHLNKSASSNSVIISKNSPLRRVISFGFLQTENTDLPDTETTKTIKEESLTSTETCESDLKSVTPILRLDLIEKPVLSESDQIISQIDTHSLRLDCQSPTQPKPEENLPSSPVTCDTPDRTMELLNSTCDLSPISSTSSLEELTVLPNTKQKKSNLSSSFVRGSKLLQMVNVQMGASPSLAYAKKRRTKTAQEENVNILTFSREIPSPLTVPGGSILKRKFNHSDDVGLTPPSKRKRVNFSDPAISEKRIFLKDDEHIEADDQISVSNTSSDSYISEEIIDDLNNLIDKTNEHGVSPDNLSKLFLGVFDREGMLPNIKAFCDLKYKEDNDPKKIIQEQISKLNGVEIANVIKECLSKIEQQEVPDEVKSAVQQSEAIDKLVAPLADHSKVLERKQISDALENCPMGKLKDFLDTLYEVSENDEDKKSFIQSFIVEKSQNLAANQFNDLIASYCIKNCESSSIIIIENLLKRLSDAMPANKDTLNLFVNAMHNFVQRLP